ncbi:LPXTG cell wall anchor domain-containing protein [Streptomyces sp. ID05-26A]|nr:LPXTG cell wall anchor domain-containing protein [Streptomyces sp. ID05-26A]
MARRVLGAFAVTATAAVATLAMATPASAHDANWSASCDAKANATKVSFNLTRYVKKGKNTVVLTDGNTELKKTDFEESIKWSKNDLDPTIKHVFRIVVTSWDGHNKDETKTVEACVTKPTTTTTKPTTTTTKPTTTTTTVATSPEVPSTSEAPSTTPVAPGGSNPEPPLAATGASPTGLLLAGLGLVGAGAGTLLFLRRRRSA